MYVSVCKIRLFLNIAYEGPDLRGNLRNTIVFADSENKPVKEGLINGVVAFTIIG